MLILNPEILRFEDLTWEDVIAVAVDHQPHRLVEEWSDLGPFQAFADVPERRTIIKVTRRITRSEPDLDSPQLGRGGTLVFYTSTENTDASRVRISITAVLIAIKTDLNTPDPAARTSAKPAATQTLTFIAVSPDAGESDPIELTPAELTD